MPGGSFREADSGAASGVDTAWQSNAMRPSPLACTSILIFQCGTCGACKVPGIEGGLPMLPGLKFSAVKLDVCSLDTDVYVLVAQEQIQDQRFAS